MTHRNNAPSTAIGLKDLARIVGLSPTTVSRALNGYSDVSESTRARVLAAASLHGYRPNSLAQRLATGRTNAVGLVYPAESGQLADPHFLQSLSGMSRRFGQAGMDLLVVTTGGGDELASYARLLEARRFDALVVTRTRVQDPRLAWLDENGFPHVVHGRTRTPSRAPWADVDHLAGARLAWRRLRGLGHRSLAYLHAPLEHDFALRRQEGMDTALMEAGDAPPVRIHAGASERSGYDAIRRLLDLPNRPTAIVVDNGRAASGAVRALLDRNLVPGSDISVLAWDGVADNDFTGGPSITAIEHASPDDVGVQLADMTLAMLQAPDHPPSNVLWEPRLRIGVSDGPPRPAR